MAPQEGAGSEASAWPPVEWEEVDWEPDPAGMYTKRERQAQTGTYRRAVPPRIATIVPRIPAGLAAQVEEASSEIVRFDAEMGVEVAPYGAVLLRSESAASSRIEHLTASARSIVAAEVGEDVGRNAAEIVANTRLLREAVSLVDRVDARAILSWHHTLMEAQYPGHAGRWRRQQVWIGPGEAGPRTADFVPPAHGAVPGLIDDLIAFMRRGDIPVLAQAAIAHAQFETIHPFVDGNGRTGRALVQVLLRHKGLTEQAPVPVSAGLLADTASYFGALDAYRSGEIAPIVSMLSLASIRAVRNGRALVAGLRDVRQSWDSRIEARRQADTWRLADLLVRRPVVTTEILARDLGVLPNNAARVIAPLERGGILVASAGSRRGTKVWRAPEIIDQLDAFAERAGRRNWG